jgi:DNA modification methylase
METYGSNAAKPALEFIELDDLNVWPEHARRHSQKVIKTLTASIKKNGILEPVVIDENNTILSGHLRAQSARNLGYSHIPVIRITWLSEAQKRAFVIAANRIPELGSWDPEKLRLELGKLVEFSAEPLDLEVTGFESGEIDLIVQHDESAAEGVAGEVFPDIPASPVSRLGDLWHLGEHRLLCGDGLKEACWVALMGDDRAQLCFTDPPYNVPIAGHVSSKGHDEFAMASGEMSPEAFINFLIIALTFAIRYSHDGALHFIAMDHRHLRELYAACDPIYARQLNLIVWAKTNAGMGSLYRSRHELFALYKVGTAKHINNVQLGRFGRNRSNVWTYAGANTFRKGRDQDLADHPTVKPTALVADAILDTTHPKDVVIDGFGGSGTLILAADQTGRYARVMEIDPRYVDVAIKRFEAQSGIKARLAGSDASFREVKAARAQKLLPAPKVHDGEAA